MSRPNFFGLLRARLKGQLPELAPAPSQRATTSSRTGGKVHRGIVWVQRDALVRCDDCGAMWSGDGPHAPHHNAAGVLVDCQQRPVTP